MKSKFLLAWFAWMVFTGISQTALASAPQLSIDDEVALVAKVDSNKGSSAFVPVAKYHYLKDGPLQGVYALTDFPSAYAVTSYKQNAKWYKEVESDQSTRVGIVRGSAVYVGTPTPTTGQVKAIYSGGYAIVAILNTSKETAEENTKDSAKSSAEISSILFPVLTIIAPIRLLSPSVVRKGKLRIGNQVAWTDAAAHSSSSQDQASGVADMIFANDMVQIQPDDRAQTSLYLHFSRLTLPRKSETLAYESANVDGYGSLAQD